MLVRGSDRGETLVEVLVAVVVLGMAAVAILAGFQLSLTGSVLGRNQANGGAYVRSLAESIQNHVADTSSIATGNYKTCGVGYNTSAYTGAAGIPATYSISISVYAWASGGWSACPATDTGVQRLDLTVTSPGTLGGIHRAIEKLTVIVREPCSGPAGSSAC